MVLVEFVHCEVPWFEMEKDKYVLDFEDVHVPYMKSLAHQYKAFVFEGDVECVLKEIFVMELRHKQVVNLMDIVLWKKVVRVMVEKNGVLMATHLD